MKAEDRPNFGTWSGNINLHPRPSRPENRFQRYGYVGLEMAEEKSLQQIPTTKLHDSNSSIEEADIGQHS